MRASLSYTAYMNDLLEQRAENLDRFYQLYINHVIHRGLRGSMSDFIQWLSEEYPEVYVEEFPQFGGEADDARP
jgi:hypothetical protein